MPCPFLCLNPIQTDICIFICTWWHCVAVLLTICVFTCPAGTRAETSSRVTGKEGFEADGIQGLKALGVRELSYRLAFLANHVAPTNPRVRTSVGVLRETCLSLLTRLTTLQCTGHFETLPRTVDARCLGVRCTILCVLLGNRVVVLIC